MRMSGDWEVRGLFGNEYAMENAVDELKKLEQVPEFKVIDRRNLSVVMSKRDTKTRDLVRNIIVIAHGFVEADAPFGQYEAKQAEIKRKKLKEYEAKRKKASQAQN